MVLASVFVILAAAMCVAAVLAILGITHVYMSGSAGIEHDGMAPGTRAPAWTLADSTGRVYHSPPAKPMQLVVFSDGSLKHFPSVVDGLRELADSAPDLEIVVLLDHAKDLAEPILRVLGLGDIPVLTGSETLYGRYNVRVTPFLIFVDSAGRARASSLVNHAWQVMTLHRVAGIPLQTADQAASRRFRRRMPQAQG